MKLNSIYCGDCQRVLGNTIEFPNESVDLIYADPPFFSNKQYEVLWGDGYELRAFEDRWKGGIENYISWMEPKLREIHRVLKRTGSFYLHCDGHASHYLKVLLDKIFERGQFINEIVWERSHTRSSISKVFRRTHDVILFYSKTKRYTFNQQFSELSKTSMNLYKSNKDSNGYYRLVPLLVSGKRNGETGKTWRGIDPNTRGKAGCHWVTTPDKLEEYDRKGLIVWPSNSTHLPQLKYYLKNNKGVPLGDIWDDVGIIEASSKEDYGFPTQKPLSLLERIVKTSSNEEDVVLDPFCGCGTTIEAAYKLNRKWIGIDVSPTACKLIIKRLHSIGSNVTHNDIIGLPKTEKEILSMQPFEFQNWVIGKLMGRVSTRKTGDMGIDGYLFYGTPIQVKQSEDIGRNVVDNFETAIRRANKNKGIIVAISFGKGAYEEVARVKNQEGLEITLMTLKELIELE